MTTFPNENYALKVLQPVVSKTIEIGNLRAYLSKSHFQRNCLLSYTHMIIFQKIGVWTWFWYQMKAKSVLLTITATTHFTQKVTHFLAVLWECITSLYVLFISGSNGEMYIPSYQWRIQDPGREDSNKRWRDWHYLVSFHPFTWLDDL